MLQVAYISRPDEKPRKQRQTANDRLHAGAIAEVARQRMLDRKAAKKRFEPHRRELEELENELKRLNETCQEQKKRRC
jgi:hypothetical protein